MADPILIIVLAYLHIGSAIGWLGGVLLTAFVVGPGLQSVSPPARLEFIAKVQPKIIRYFVGMITGTILFGLLLLYFLIGGDLALLSPSTSFGAALSAGIALAIIAVVVAGAVIIPSFQKVIAIAGQVLKSGQTPPPPELMKFSKRARMGSEIVAVLLLVVLVMMVTAGFY